jgi:outer membrane immunogenic protein
MQTYKLVKLFLASAALATVMQASATTVSGAADVPQRAYEAPYFLWTGLYVGAHVGRGWFDDNGSTVSGWVGGGQVGYNYQIGRWVWGAELEVSGTGIDHVDTVTTLMAKGGYAFDRHWLIYGKFGAGWITESFGGSSVTGSSAVFGVGTEYAFTPRWSAKLEYNFFDLAHDSAGNSASFQTVKAGVNYKLGPGLWPF